MSVSVWDCLNLRELRYAGIASSEVFLRSVVIVSIYSWICGVQPCFYQLMSRPQSFLVQQP